MPWVRSGSSEMGISLSEVSGADKGWVSCDGSATLRGSEGVEFCGGGGVMGCCCCGGGGGEELGLREGAPNLEGGGGLPAFAMPLLHMVGTAGKAGSARLVEGDEAHLETAAG